MVSKECGGKCPDPSNFTGFTYASFLFFLNFFLILYLNRGRGLDTVFVIFVQVFLVMMPVFAYSGAYNSSNYGYVKPWRIDMDEKY